MKRFFPLLLLVFAGLSSDRPAKEAASLSRDDRHQQRESETLDDQSFWVELEDWGKVRFVSNRQRAGGTSKLGFFLADAEGKTIYRFPEFYGNRWSSFFDLKAVAFRDADRDGFKDVLLIADYITGIGPQGAIPFPVGSVYFRRGKSFSSLPDFDERLNEAKKNESIDMMVEFAADFFRASKNGLDAPTVRATPLPASVAGVAKPLLSLSGTWQFHPAPPKSFETLTEKNAAGWSPIQVPGDWTMQGFAVTPWTPAGYLKTFDLPADWRNSRVILRFDGVQSDARVWVNGRPAGSHEGGFTAFEFDVTNLCRPGEANTIAAAVQNESMADILASGTQYAAYQFGGLTRKVTLIAVPALHLTEIEASADVPVDGTPAYYRLTVSVVNAGTAPEADFELGLSLLDPEGESILRTTKGKLSLKTGQSGRFAFSGPLKDRDLWDAEHPRLHRLSVDLIAGGRTVETVTRRVGFREVEVAGTRVLVNGRPVKLKGINRHETHPLLGRSLTPELWRKDAELFRAANINYIRTSHYPPAEEFLDACDELGLFVECEAALVWVNHGANEFWKKENPTDPKFRPLILRAVAENVAFNRRHPSVIFWSLANESGWSGHFAAAEAMVKALDPTRPRTFHDQAYGGYNNLGSTVLPVANYHYPGPQGPDLAVGLNLPRPLFYGEYCHLNTYNRTELAADPGVRDEYGRGFQRMWERIFGSSYVVGGAIWSGVDDVFFLPSGRATGYGEWGPVDGWRREKPEYWHIKKSYSPVIIKPDRVSPPPPGEPIILLVENRHDFTNLKECRIDWRIGEEEGRAELDLAPRGTGVLRIRPKTAHLAGTSLRLEVGSPRGFVIDRTDIAIVEVTPFSPPRPLPAGGRSVRLVSNPGSLAADGGSFRWVFDRKTGAILEASAGGAAIVTGGPALMLLPQTTGPCVTDYSLDIKPSNDLCAAWAASSVEAKEEAGAVILTAKGKYAEAEGFTEVRVDGTGKAEFRYQFKVGARINPRQYGLVVFLPRPFDTLSWIRQAQWTAYPENHIGRPRGTAKALVPGREFKFRVPPAWDWKDDQNELGSNDFRSTKANILWAALTSGEGRGLLVESDGRHAARAFLAEDRVGWLIADFNTGGGDMFFASHHKMDDRPLEAGEVIKGSFVLSLF